MFSLFTEKILKLMMDFEQQSLQSLKADNQTTQKYKMAMYDQKGKVIFKETHVYGTTKGAKNANDVQVVGFSPIFTRDASVSNESSRQHSSLINPQLCLISFQLTPSYIDIISEYTQANMLDKLEIYKTHTKQKATVHVEVHTFKIVQILDVKAYLMGNSALCTILIQSNGAKVEFKSVSGDVNQQKGSNVCEILSTGLLK